MILIISFKRSVYEVWYKICPRHRLTFEKFEILLTPIKSMNTQSLKDFSVYDTFLDLRTQVPGIFFDIMGVTKDFSYFYMNLEGELCSKL